MGNHCFTCADMYSKNRQEAEEILQEGFVLVFRKLHQYRFDGPFEGWLRRIMVNQALEQYKSRAHLQASFTTDMDSANSWAEEEALSQLSVKE